MSALDLQRKPARFKNLGLAWIMAAVLLPVVVWLAVSTVSDHGNYAAYEQASACPASAVNTGCLRTVTASVAGGQDEGGDYWLNLVGPGISSQQVKLSGSCDGQDLYDSARAVGKVQAQLWRGGVAEVGVEGYSCALAGSPGNAYAKALGELLIVGPLDLFIVLVCGWSFTRARFGPGPAQLVGRTAMGYLVVMFLLVGAGVGLAATGQPVASSVYLGDGVILVVFAIGGIAALIYRRGKVRRSREWAATHPQS